MAREVGRDEEEGRGGGKKKTKVAGWEGEGWRRLELPCIICFQASGDLIELSLIDS